MLGLQIISASFQEVQFRAVAQFNHHLSSKRGYKIAWKPMTLASAQWRLDRVAVNFIRHQLTNYDSVIVMLGRDAERIRSVRLEILGAIAVAYPQVADECGRQAFLTRLRLVL